MACAIDHYGISRLTMFVGMLDCPEAERARNEKYQVPDDRFSTMYVDTVGLSICTDCVNAPALLPYRILNPDRSVSALPSRLRVGADQLRVTLPDATCATVIENDGRSVVATPSDTAMTMPEYVPTPAAVGVPESRPVVVEKLAQLGLLCMLNASVLPSGSDAVG